MEIKVQEHRIKIQMHYKLLCAHNIEQMELKIEDLDKKLSDESVKATQSSEDLAQLKVCCHSTSKGAAQCLSSQPKINLAC